METVLSTIAATLGASLLVAPAVVAYQKPKFYLDHGWRIFSWLSLRLVTVTIGWQVAVGVFQSRVYEAATGGGALGVGSVAARMFAEGWVVLLAAVALLGYSYILERVARALVNAREHDAL